jgi:hypothetical protein
MLTAADDTTDDFSDGSGITPSRSFFCLRSQPPLPRDLDQHGVFADKPATATLLAAQHSLEQQPPSSLPTDSNSLSGFS